MWWWTPHQERNCRHLDPRILEPETVGKEFLFQNAQHRVFCYSSSDWSCCHCTITELLPPEPAKESPTPDWTTCKPIPGHSEMLSNNWVRLSYIDQSQGQRLIFVKDFFKRLKRWLTG